jgi:hypothetical protein
MLEPASPPGQHARDTRGGGKRPEANAEAFSGGFIAGFSIARCPCPFGKLLQRPISQATSFRSTGIPVILAKKYATAISEAKAAGALLR